MRHMIISQMRMRPKVWIKQVQKKDGRRDDEVENLRIRLNYSSLAYFLFSVNPPFHDFHIFFYT